MKTKEVNKTKTIILLFILIALGGLILYREKDKNFTIKSLSSPKIITNSK